jgi:hypothetical protein
MREASEENAVIIPLDTPNDKVGTEFPSTSSLSEAHVPELQVLK